MNKGKTRAAAALLAAMLFCCVTAMPVAAAAPATIQAASLVDTLKDVPLLGDILRFFMGDSEPETPEATPTPEPTPTPTPEPTATPEPTPTEGAPDWPESWMQGSAWRYSIYPGGTEGAETPTCDVTLWGTVGVTEDVSIQVVNREETNLGDLVTDAMAMAAAASPEYQNSDTLAKLPIVALLDGASITDTLEAGTTLTAQNCSAALSEEDTALVRVTPKKLLEVLNTTLLGIKPDSENYGSFVQVSGLQFHYEVTNGIAHANQMRLADASGAVALEEGDDETGIALVLPQKLLENFGLMEQDGYPNAYAAEGTGFTVPQAVAALAQNCDEQTLAAILARQGNAGRIWPAAQAPFAAGLTLGEDYPDKAVAALVDGNEATGLTDDTGVLLLEGLAAGNHTIRIAGDETDYYVSSYTFIGVPGGTAVNVTKVPAESVTNAPVVSEEPTAAPEASPAASQADGSEAQGEDATSDAASEEPATTPEPEQTSTPEPTPTEAPSTGSEAAVADPSAGLVLNVTPAPTLEPTATPEPTPTPTPNPKTEAAKQTATQVSGMLPLIIVGAGALVFVVILIVGLLRKNSGKKKRKKRGRSRRI